MKRAEQCVLQRVTAKNTKNTKVGGAEKRSIPDPLSPLVLLVCLVCLAVISSNMKNGACGACGTAIPGRFSDAIGTWGRKRMRVVV
jgi:hypothetical protein